MLKPNLITVGVLGSDFPGVRPILMVDEGDKVSVGDKLFHDKRDAQICAFSPVSGRVNQILRGAGRALTAISIDQMDDSEPFVAGVDSTMPKNRDALIALLSASGLWTRLRQRPFGTVPLTNTRPQKLFISAMDSSPGVVDPITLIHQEMEAFRSGLEAFCLLPTEETFLCVKQTLPVAPVKSGSLQQVVFGRAFSGNYAADLAGTHIHRLADPSPEHPVFSIDIRTVLELGWLLSGARAKKDRDVYISGKSLSRPGWYSAPPGASIKDLLAQAGGSFDQPNIRVVAGSTLAGRLVGTNSAYLGASEDQLQVLAEAPLMGSRGLPGLPLFDRTNLLARTGLNRIFPQVGTYLNGAIAGMVPAESIERVWPHSVPVIPLLRALLTEDDETALELGALAFVEEDMSLVSWACPGKYDYGQALRAFLKRVQQDLS